MDDGTKYCDVCHNQMLSSDDYKIIDRMMHEYDDDFIRICVSCETEDGE